MTRHQYPVQVEVTIFMDHLELNRMVKEILGFTFNFQFATHCPDNTIVEYVVDGILPTITLPWAIRAEELRRGKRTREVALILNVLAEDGHIPHGKYRITTGTVDRTVIFEAGKWSFRKLKPTVRVRRADR